MNTAEWIIVAILSLTLFVFLVCGILLCIKLISLTKKAQVVVETGQKIAETGQKVAEKTESVVENVRDLTSVGGIVKAVAKRIETPAGSPKSTTTSKSPKDEKPAKAQKKS